MSIFRDKVELLNNYLAKQCTVINSGIPTTVNIKIAKTLSSISVTRADIANIKIFLIY